MKTTRRISKRRARVLKKRGELVWWHTGFRHYYWEMQWHLKPVTVEGKNYRMRCYFN